MYKKISNLISVIRFYVLAVLFYPLIKANGRNYFKSGDLIVGPGAKFALNRNNFLDRGYVLQVTGQFVIGSHNYFNKNVKIVCFDRIDIGDDCLFADSVHIYDHDHRYDDLSRPISTQGYVTAPVKIGNNVLLGAKVTVLKGVTIGDGVIVGANSVVTKDLPVNSICGGIPAKVIKMREGANA